MKKGFTLIELLAVIVILAIIALIATPIILGIIKDAKENAFKSSIDGIARTALTESVLNIKGEDILYKYENNNWTSNKLDIDGQLPKYVEIKVNKEGKVSYAITDGVYCATKEYDSELTIKRIGNENNNKEIQELHCMLDAVIPTNINCFTFTDNTNKTEIKGYTCSDLKEIVIPEGVTSIRSGAFRDKSLISVIIPEGVTSIGDYAFQDNELKSITIPSSVTSIENHAFRGNGLTSVTMPSDEESKLEKIGISAFYGNYLKEITIPSTVTNIGGGAFNNNLFPANEAFIYNRNDDGSIDYSKIISYAGSVRDNLIIPSQVNGITLTSIGDLAFSDVKLTSVVIPNTVTNIENSAFYNCSSLTSIEIPDSVISIGNYAFMSSGMLNVTIGKNVTSIGDLAFSSNKLTNLEIPDNVTSIQRMAFYNNKLKGITIGKKVTTIGERAFFMNELEKIIIPSNITSIGDNAFSSNKLTSVTIEGKSSTSGFTSYPSTSPFGWSTESECKNDETKCITWKGTN